MKYKVIKPFNWAHNHVQIKSYVKGQIIETDDKDLIRVAKEEKWIAEAKSADVDDQSKAIQADIASLQAQLDEAEEADIQAIEAQLAAQQAALVALQS